MKYLCFLLLIGASFSACKKDESKTTSKITTPRLPSGFTGLKTWRYSNSYIVYHGNPYRDTTITGVDTFSIITSDVDTIFVGGKGRYGSNKLCYTSSDTTSTGYALNYSFVGTGYTNGTLVKKAKFLHTNTGDTIFYSESYSKLGFNDQNHYVTP